ncbi:MAG: VWA domain-containing protein [Bryobacteraceae bacterium]|jgi:VWFA-related protein
MKLARIAALLICAAGPSLDGKDASVSEIETIVTSARASGHTDAQIARHLAAVDLTERITDSTLARLVAQAAGPRTRDVLEILAEASAFLYPPVAERATAAAPSAAQQKETLARAAEQTGRYVAALPDFLCTRITRRFDDQPDLARIRPEVWAGLHLRNMFVGQLSFSHGVESYVDQTSASPDSGGDQQSALGLTSFGEFGSIIGALFIGDAAPQISWDHWETLHGTLVGVFRYSVDAAHSRYRVSWCCAPPKGPNNQIEPEVVWAAYRGELFIEAASGAILRITRQADGFPHGFPTRRVDTVVDYGPVQIGPRQYLCPIRSVTLSDMNFRNPVLGHGTVHYLNDIHFIRYHKFGAESRLLASETPDAGNVGQPEPPLWNEPDPWLELQPSDEAVQTPEEPPAPPSVLKPAGPALTIRATTQLVEVPVIVRDKRGEPVMGLKKEDFEICDNGKPQDLRVFVTESAAGRSNTPSSASTRTVPTVARRVFSNREEDSIAPNNFIVILVDRINTQWQDLAYASQEILKFLRQLPPGELAAIYSMSGDSFTVLHDLTRDSASLAKRLGSDRGKLNPDPAIAGSRQAAIDIPQTSWLNGSDSSSQRYPAGGASSGCTAGSLRVLSAVAKHLASLPGRKSLIWVSAGFPLVRFDMGSSSNCSNQLLEAVRAFNDANVAIYSVDAPGLQTAFADVMAMPPRGSDGARTFSFEFAKSVSQTHTLQIHANQSTMLELSSRTGGRAFLNANDIAGAIRTAIDDPRGSYRLGFYPQGLSHDGKYHEIQVRLVGHSGARLRYRQGFFDARSSGDSRTRLQDALLSPINAIGIPVTAELTPGSGRCELKLSVGIAALDLQLERDRWKGKIEVVMMQRGEYGEQLERLDQTLGLQLRKETYETMLKSGFEYRHSLAPKAGAASLRVVVRDSASGDLGSLTIPLNRPENQLVIRQ